MAEFVPPPLAEAVGLEPTPRPRDGVMAACRPFVAAPQHNLALGFPDQLVADWEERAVARLGELLTENRALGVYLDSCVACGACADKCHFFLGTGDANNMPVARQNLLRAVYRRHFTPAGRRLGRLAGAAPLDRARLDAWYGYFHQCSQCRRCAHFCPFGIDTAELSMAAREIMNAIGLGQKYCNEIIGKVHAIGNNLGLPRAALADTLEGLEEDVRDETGAEVRFPLDQRGAEVLLVTPSADFFAEPHIDGLIGYAKLFHQAGISWTLSSHASEAANFGLFIGSTAQMRQIARRIREAALDLGVRRIVFGECGHAWRVAHAFLDSLAGPFDFLDPAYPRPQHIVEVSTDLLARGAIRLDRDANAGMVVTLHDSCNIARATRMGAEPGGQFTLPRALIRAAVPRFVEMHPDTTHARTFCCGGGGGLLTDDLIELRIKGARPRMQALREVVERDGVTHLAALCAICKSQFTKVLPAYGFEREMVVSVHQLVGRALRLGA